MARRSWSMKFSPATLAARKRAARAEARKFLTGEKKRVWESPKMRALHGTAPWAPKDAARDAYDRRMLDTKSVQKYPMGYVEHHYATKGGEGGRKRKARTSTGGKWTLRQAGVTRDRSTGQFAKKRGKR